MSYCFWKMYFMESKIIKLEKIYRDNLDKVV